MTDQIDNLVLLTLAWGDMLRTLLIYRRDLQIEIPSSLCHRVRLHK
jgi:hypothetical protein